MTNKFHANSLNEHYLLIIAMLVSVLLDTGSYKMATTGFELNVEPLD